MRYGVAEMKPWGMGNSGGRSREVEEGGQRRVDTRRCENGEVERGVSGAGKAREGAHVLLRCGEGKKWEDPVVACRDGADELYHTLIVVESDWLHFDPLLLPREG